MAKVLDTRAGSPTLGLMIDEALLNQPVTQTQTQPQTQTQTQTNTQTYTPPSTGVMSSSEFERQFNATYGRQLTTAELTQWANAGRPSNFTSLFGSPTQTQKQTNPEIFTSSMSGFPGITMRGGLSWEQINGLSNRLNAIAGGSPITATDISNFNYALGSSWQSYLQGKGASITPTTQQTTPTTQTEGGEQTFGMDFSNLPAEITESEEWKNASDQNKMLASVMFNLQQGISQGDVALVQDMQDALNKAISVADPYFRQKIQLAQDEVLRATGKVEGDYASNLKTYQDKIKQINEDLIYNKEYLTLEQQQDLANQKQQYENELYNTQQSMAEAGLTFSSPRARAEEQLRTQNQGVVESLQRQYNKATREQQLGTERQQETLQQNIADLERAKKEGLTEISRQGEAQLGSANMPSIPGVTPLGTTTGSIEYEKQTAIPSLAQTYVDWTKVL